MMVAVAVAVVSFVLLLLLRRWPAAMPVLVGFGGEDEAEDKEEGGVCPE
jgi:hypothetical protein